MDFRVLGPVSVDSAGAPVFLGGVRQRSLLATLLMARGRAVSLSTLVDALWNNDPPASSQSALQAAVSRLRKAIGAEHLTTTAGGYRIVVADDQLDLARFEASHREGAKCAQRGALEAAVLAWEDALAQWHGQALSGVSDTPSLRSQAASLEEQRMAVLELLLGTRIDLGRYASALPELEQLAQEHPYREPLHGLLMHALYLDGRQADALSAGRRLRASLSEDLAIDPSRELDMLERDILNHEASLELTSARTSDGHLLATASPAASHSSWRSDSVPHPVGRLIGRERELTEVKPLLLKPDVRLITITGPGGVGKTRLAAELAGRARRTREVLYVALDSLATADLVMPTIAAELQVKPSADEELAVCLARAMNARELLLVLDNFEHVMDAAPELGHLINLTGPELQVLVTSRESLRIRGEHLYRVNPLATANSEVPSVVPGSVGIEVETPPPAVQLFWERAEAAAPEFRSEDSPHAAGQICEQLDGLPLAIELAAARTNILTPNQILDRLTQRLSLLTTGTRDAPSRQRSLRACLEWSVDLLASRERRVFAAISTFAGGATIASLEAVCTEALPGTDVLSAVESLVAKSLLRPVADPSGPRLMMLETVREYATELLSESEDEDEARVKLAHAHHFHDLLAAEPGPLFWPPRNSEQLDFWSAELHNARSALRTLEKAGETALCADLVVVMARVWRLRGLRAEMEAEVSALLSRPALHPSRRIDLLAWATFNAASYRDDLEGASRFIDEALKALAEVPDADRHREALMHGWAARVAFHGGHSAKALEAQVRAVNASLASEDEEVIVWIRAGLPIDDRNYLANADADLAIARRHGNQVLEEFLLGSFSEMALSHEDDDVVARAEVWGHEAHQLGLLLGSLDAQAMGMSNAATAALLLSRPTQAVRDLRISLAAARRIGDIAIQVENVLRLAAVEAAQDHLELAKFLYRAWQELAGRYAQFVSPSSQRIINKFLSDLSSLSYDRAATAAGLTLSEAVEVALEERPIPDIAQTGDTAEAESH